MGLLASTDFAGQIVIAPSGVLESFGADRDVGAQVIWGRNRTFCFSAMR